MQSSTLTHVHTSFATFCSHLPPSHPRTPKNIDLLSELLAAIPSTDFERGLGWTEWALPDQLTYDVLGALLKISGDSENKGQGSKVLQEVGSFVEGLSSRIEQADRELSFPPFENEEISSYSARSVVDVIIHAVPIFNGLYRSLTSIAHPFTFSSFTDLGSSISILLQQSTIDRLNQLLLDPASLLTASSSTSSPSGDSSIRYAHLLLARYRANGRPLSGNFLLCASLEIAWTVLAQALLPASDSSPHAIPLGNQTGDGAEASNSAWDRLLSTPVVSATDAGPVLAKGEEEAIRRSLAGALKAFADISGTIQALRGEAAVDLYPYEVVSESLVRHLPSRSVPTRAPLMNSCLLFQKLATLCSVALGSPDASLVSRLKLLLSENAAIFEPIVQEAALQSMIVLVIK